MIQILLNGEKREIKEGQTLSSLLQEFSLKEKAVVVELNRKVINRDVYPSTPLASDDVLEIVHFVGGG